MQSAYLDFPSTTHWGSKVVYREQASSHPEFGQAGEALCITEVDPLVIESIVHAVGKPEESLRQDC